MMLVKQNQGTHSPSDRHRGRIDLTDIRRRENGLEFPLANGFLSALTR